VPNSREAPAKSMWEFPVIVRSFLVHLKNKKTGIVIVDVDKAGRVHEYVT
jgi:hypothetical protein